MRKLWNEWLCWTVGIGGFVLVLAVQFAFATDLTLTNDVVIGVDSPKTAIIKLEENDDELLTFINDLKDGYASSAAPSSPNEGQMWYDNLNEVMKQYHGSTWVTQWSYADTTTIVWEGLIDANSGTIDNLEASTISAPYATLTDIDVQTADFANINIIDGTAGSFHVNTLSTGSFSRTAKVVKASLNASGTTIASSATHTPTYDTEDFDTISAWESTTNPERLTVPANTDYVRVVYSVQTTSVGETGYLAISLNHFTSADTLLETWRIQAPVTYDLSGSLSGIVEGQVASGVVSVEADDYFKAFLDNEIAGTTTIVGGGVSQITMEGLDD